LTQALHQVKLVEDKAVSIAQHAQQKEEESAQAFRAVMDGFKKGVTGVLDTELVGREIVIKDIDVIDSFEDAELDKIYDQIDSIIKFQQSEIQKKASMKKERKDEEEEEEEEGEGEDNEDLEREYADLVKKIRHKSVDTSVWFSKRQQVEDKIYLSSEEKKVSEYVTKIVE
ncbi:hypothetical protein ADUPG1_011911, partial [Aduncisulcus paluster]